MASQGGDSSPAQPPKVSEPPAAVASEAVPKVAGDGNQESEGINWVRWLAYLARVKAIAMKTTAISLKAGPMRYFAFTSDVGEAFRPAVAPWIVNTSYAISVGYIGGTIVEAGYSAHRDGKERKEIGVSMAEEATFQFLASLLLPFLVIHTAVHKTAVMLKARNVHLTRPLIAKWAPSAVGLGCIPLLPTLVDKPCEHAVEAFFHKFVKQEHNWSNDFLKYRQASSQLHTLFGKRDKDKTE